MGLPGSSVAGNHASPAAMLALLGPFNLLLTDEIAFYWSADLRLVTNVKTCQTIVHFYTNAMAGT